MKKIGIACGGGTTKGSRYLRPVGKAIAEAGGIRNVRGLVGCSIGSWTAVKAGEGASGIQEMEQAWRGMKGPGYFLKAQIDVWNGLTSLKPLRKLGMELIKPDALKTDVYVLIFDSGDGHPRQVRVNGLSKLDIVDLCIVSSTQPGLMDSKQAKFRWPAGTGKHRYGIDGGAGGPTCPMPVFAEDCTELHAFFASSPFPWHRREKREQRKCNNAHEAVMIMSRGLLARSAFLDYLMFRAYAAQTGRPVYAYYPQTEQHSPFASDPDTIDSYLTTFGDYLWQHRELLPLDFDIPFDWMTDTDR